MTSTITIPFWPTSQDCISWSEDNHIAVVGGESIAILTPRLQELGPNGRQWDSTIIKVNAFTEPEVPLLAPLSNANFSVGEELSLRQAVNAQWSSQGLAPHGGCALAVFSAHHVLSIWTPTGSPTVAANWRRQLIINHTVRQYYACRDGLDEDDDGFELSEEAQKQQRISAFAWSPPFPDPYHSVQRYGHFLAVATHGGDVLILRVTSPDTGIFTRCSDWSAIVTGSLKDVSHSRVASHLAWSDWKLDDQGRHVARLAYITAGKLFTVPLLASFSDAHAEVDVLSHEDGRWRWHLQKTPGLTGPLRFVPSQDTSQLVAFGENAVFQIDAGTEAADGFVSHHLDDRWDDVSGIAFSNSGDGGFVLHITSIISSATANTTALPIPLKEHQDEFEVEPAWQEAIRSSKGTFSVEHDLAGHVSERTWGIAASPLGDCVATCVSMHPSDAIAYVVASEQWSVLNISHESQTSPNMCLPKPWSHRRIPVEAVVFDIQSQRERDSFFIPSSTGMDRDALIAEITNYIRPTLHDIEADTNLVDDSLHGLIHRIRQVVYGDSVVLAKRASLLVNITLDRNARRRELIREVIQLLLASALELPSTKLHADALGEGIKKIYKLVLSKMNAKDISTSESTGERLEICKMCQQDIPFESLKWAKCSSGHQFSRCALSFLAIQEPGTTKACGLCGLQYLNLTALSGFQSAADDIEMADVPDPETGASNPPNDTWVQISRTAARSEAPRTTLAQLLFAACAICVYCGGKFVDGR